MADAAYRLKAYFRSFDRNGDGKISAEEFKGFFSDMSDADIDKMWKAGDKNQDGYIDYNEFSDWVMAANVSTASLMGKSMIKVEEATPERMAEIEEIFSKVDTEGNGWITAEDVATYMSTIGAKVSLEECMEFIRECQPDATEKSRISIIDFAAIMMRMGNQ